jgi:hypothetical protein
VSVAIPPHTSVDTVKYMVAGRVVTLPLKAGSQVDASVVGAFPPKQAIGDYTEKDHTVLSTLAQSDWIGGGQITESDEAVDINRYHGIATLETRYPRAMTLLPLSEYHEGTLAVHPLGDLGGTFYYADALDIYSAEGTTVLDTGDDIGFTPTGKCVLFTGNTGGATKLYIPQGTNGYDVYDGATVSHQTGADPVGFARWGKQLWCVEANGDVRQSLDGTTWTTKVQTDPANDMRGLLKFYDRSDNPALVLIDDQGIQALDVASGEAWDTEFHDIPPQDEAGVAFAKWRADVFYAFGMGIFRYTFSTRNAQGLDRDDGVPAEYRGHIVDLEGTMNDLFALVKGKEVAGEADEPEYEFEGEEEYAIQVAPGTARSFLARYDGVGWHTLWAADQDAGAPTRMFVSRTSEGGMLYWGVGNRLYSCQLSTAFQNPKENPQARFAETGRLESSRLNMGMIGSRQALSEIRVRTEACTATEVVRVYYRTDLRDWTLLGSITTGPAEGESLLTEYQIGANGTWPDPMATPRYEGEMFSWMQYAIEMDRDPADDTKSPVVKSVSVVTLKIPGVVHSFSFTVDCSTVGDALNDVYGMGNWERQRFVEGMTDWGRSEGEEGPFFGFQHRNRWHNVRQTGCSGRDLSGQDLRGDRRVTVLDVFEMEGSPIDFLPEEGS